MFRLSALALGLCLALTGCGVSLVKPTQAAVEQTSTAPRVNPNLPPPPVDPLVLALGQTVVTLTFDDGRDSNVRAAQIMNAYGLRATFFVNSGTIGAPPTDTGGYLSLADLDWIATNSGNEIGGHTVHHPNTATLSADEFRREVCDDRAALMNWGFPVRNFAYPNGYHSDEFEAVVASCGYNSARALDDGVVGPPAELVPPGDVFRTRSPVVAMANSTVSGMQQAVDAAIGSGGGWVQFTFHGICPTTCSEITPSVQTFTAFVIWLADQQAQGRVLVRTVGEVIGGPVAPVPPVTP